MQLAPWPQCPATVFFGRRSRRLRHRQRNRRPRALSSPQIPKECMDFDISNIMSTNNELLMKLLIDTKAQKVCFAEAGNDVVEFLSCLLCLPMSTIIKVLTKERMVGSIANLHDSLRGLDTKYVFSHQSKEPCLKASIVPTIYGSQRQRQTPLDAYTCFFTCEGDSELYNFPLPSSCGYISAISGAICPHCTRPMVQEMRHVQAHGYVIATDKYTVTDDLSIAPASSISSSIALLVQCGMMDLSMLQEKTVKIGKEEALEILRASLSSRTVMTDVFLQNKKGSAVQEGNSPLVTSDSPQNLVAREE
ncbi:hypothetical protein PR202_ga23420 [Eleusine coracana subsp. coracana]|uniref:Uncharacterized protein n=1 Tax=Eleusine coracana subsp. coracana TaxID=191504 RepID=A0AAV5D6K6_ELECO|nr:hypothetical protein PR202_ga23420 [Eleusine coracana subsp. coracana]